MVGTETAQRLRLLEADLEDAPLALDALADIDIYGDDDARALFATISPHRSWDNSHYVAQLRARLEKPIVALETIYTPITTLSCDRVCIDFQELL
ncbi:hypothetical protein A6E15_18080 [Natrinema saccharevitans]|uniref:Uncharacterized protein n=1 Tax=Natrinema saccharevitans TaxID=301967 RepID=A0A1S8ARS1_9EURY|nr:hypothetical protein [Natrinema saccharevitans]OLZ39306.1 hypothetical protein A6E15_18080 [Natrinema saccharevitans]